MDARIENLKERKLVGIHLRMSYADNRTVELWKSFMSDRNKIANRTSSEFISMQIFPPTFDFLNFDPTIIFEKWATVEVSDFSSVPDGMESFTLPGGLYAVFIHKGTSANAPKTFGFIFNTWLPDSNYELDDRPHFEILGDKYKREDPDSEEEIWIPIKPK